MAITQRNTYIPGQNIMNMANNIDYNRLNDCKARITVNFGVSPASVTVKVGSIIEVNGNLYCITGADYTFAMANAAHNYLTFTDNPGTAFSSSASMGTYDAAKQGYYQAGNIIRTLPFYIDQANSEVSYMMDENYNNIRPRMKIWSRVQVSMSANQLLGAGVEVIKFDTETYDELGEWNVGTYTFTAYESGRYMIDVTATIDGQAVGVACDALLGISINAGAPTAGCLVVSVPNAFSPFIASGSVHKLQYLKAGDHVTFVVSNGFGANNSTVYADRLGGFWKTSCASIVRII